VTPLKEIRTRDACPIVSSDKGLRTQTTTFLVGNHGVLAIEKDGQDITVRGDADTLVIPFSACCWVRPDQSAIVRQGEAGAVEIKALASAAKSLAKGKK
jgi:hypothetical protein